MDVAITADCLDNRPSRLVILGDSHALWSFASVRPAKFIHVGPVTMHRAARDGIQGLLPGSYKPRTSDALILSFGEIDCRVHLAAIGKRSGRGLEAEVELLCDRFASAASTFAQTFPGRVFVASVIPPAHFGRGIKRDATPLEEYLAEQVLARSLMNRCLSNIPDVSFFDYRADITASDGTLPDRLSDGRWHLDPEAAGQFIVERINQRRDLPSVRHVEPPRNPKTLDKRYGIRNKLKKWSRPYRRRVTALVRFKGLPPR